VAVSSAERGLLILKVRDEIREVMTTYQSLYESSIAFGMRKALLAEQKRAELSSKVSLFIKGGRGLVGVCLHQLSTLLRTHPVVPATHTYSLHPP